MSFFNLRYTCIILTTTFNLLLPVCMSQTVSFTTTNATVVVGQKVDLSCAVDDLISEDYELVISFQNQTLVEVENGTLVQQRNVPSGRYNSTIDQLEGMGILVILIIQTISDIDAGLYQCMIRSPSQPSQASDEVQLTVIDLPKPTCLGPNDLPHASYDAVTGELTVEGRFQTLVVCVVLDDSATIPVNLIWTRSDGQTVDQDRYISPAAALFLPSIEDDGIIFTCTSQNDNYEGVYHTCNVKVILSANFTLPTSTIPTTINAQTTATESNSNISDGTLTTSTIHTPDTSKPIETTTESKSTTPLLGMSTSTHHAQTNSKPITTTTERKTTNLLGGVSTSTYHTQSNSTPITTADVEGDVDHVGVPLLVIIIICAGGSVGILVLALTLAACSYCIRSARRKSETLDDKNAHLDTLTISERYLSISLDDGINNSTTELSMAPINKSISRSDSIESEHTYPIDHKEFESDIYMDPDGNALDDQTIITNSAIEKLVANVGESRSVTDPNVPSRIYEDVPKDNTDISRLYDEVPNDNMDIHLIAHSTPIHAGVNGNPNHIPSGKTLSDLPVYAEVNKNRKSITSVSSAGDEHAPSYASVDKNRLREA